MFLERIKGKYLAEEKHSKLDKARMKFISLAGILLVIFAVTDHTKGYKCTTSDVAKDCNICSCNPKTGKITYCTRIGCENIKCAEGDKKIDERGRDCECEDNSWYCEWKKRAVYHLPVDLTGVVRDN